MLFFRVILNSNGLKIHVNNKKTNERFYKNWLSAYVFSISKVTVYTVNEKLNKKPKHLRITGRDFYAVISLFTILMLLNCFLSVIIVWNILEHFLLLRNTKNGQCVQNYDTGTNNL